MAQHAYERYKQRRKKLLSLISQLKPSDLILIPAAIEPHSSRFIQDKNFYYFTGLQEPAAMLCITGEGQETLFVPNYNGLRAQWVAHELVPSEHAARELNVDEIVYQGDTVRGYSFVPFRRDAQYEHFFSFVKNKLGSDGVLHVIGQPGWQMDSYAQQMSWFLGKFMPALVEQQRLVDISPQVGELRRCKDDYEISCIEKAIEITAQAQQAAQAALVEGKRECDAVAALEGVFTQQGSMTPAFPSIVAAGKNATILHYLEEQTALKKGDAVVVDIGASFDGYAADITRTYPVGGAFSTRQAEIYDVVLEAQVYIADIAAPGFYMHHPEKKEESLNHMVHAFFEKRGFGGLMPHSVSHYMGLDVHDVGDRFAPLAPGDVITIEPGLYLPDEGIGVRIEDDYLITEDGVRCLSPQIKKQRADIEGGV